MEISAQEKEFSFFSGVKRAINDQESISNNLISSIKRLNLKEEEK